MKKSSYLIRFYLIIKMSFEDQKIDAKRVRAWMYNDFSSHFAIQSKSIEMAKSQCSYIFVDDDKKGEFKVPFDDFFLASVFSTKIKKKYFANFYMFDIWEHINLVLTTCHRIELINILKRAIISRLLELFSHEKCTFVKPLWRVSEKFLMNSLPLAFTDSL